MQRVPFFFFLLGLFVLDFWTKQYVHGSIPLIYTTSLCYPFGGVNVFDNFMGISCAIVHATNTGAAWGVFADWQKALFACRIAIILCMFLYLFSKKFHIQGEWYKRFFLTLLVGAASNVLDKLIYGHVVDMFYFRFGSYVYPVFNIADSMIVVAVSAMGYLQWKQKRIVTV